MSIKELVEEMQAVGREYMDGVLSFKDASSIIEDLKSRYFSLVGK